MVRRRKPPSQTWRTFLNNHVKNLVSVDFFAVPTILSLANSKLDVKSAVWWTWYIAEMRDFLFPSASLDRHDRPPGQARRIPERSRRVRSHEASASDPESRAQTRA
jgi:hypothetical protein